MRFRPCAVTVTQLPESLDGKRCRLFFKELESRMNIERPCIVLDCSKVQEMDRIALHMLLCCLEEAMKRDGDVKLAAVQVSARQVIEAARLDRLFEIYESEAEAVSSFFHPHFKHALYAGDAQDRSEFSESAA